MKLIKIIPASLVLISLFFAISSSPYDALAQTSAGNTSTSIAGDDLCGKWDPVNATVTKPCDIDFAASAVKGILSLILILGAPLLVLVVVYRFTRAWFAAKEGNTNAYKDALRSSGYSVAGFLLIVALFAGLMTVILQFLGVKDAPLTLIKLFSEAFVDHAYAASSTTSSAPQSLPNFLKSSNLYDFMISVLRVVMRFFIYPALIVIWVWTGFAFVAAQGNPEAINKAKKWLIGALITTLSVFMVQAFLVALKGTVEEILPGAAASQTTGSPTGTTDGRGKPSPGTAGEACTTDSGGTGQLGGDPLKCQGGRGGGSGNGASSNTNECTGKTLGTLCTVVAATGNKTGTCSNNDDLVFGCYVATQGDTCISGAGVYGYITASGGCAPGGRPLTPSGGSCITTASCANPLACVNNRCQLP